MLESCYSTILSSHSSAFPWSLFLRLKVRCFQLYCCINGRFLQSQLSECIPNRVPTDLSAAVRGAELTHWWNKARGVAAAVSATIGGDVCMPDISYKWSGSALAIPGFPSSFPPSSPAICSALAAPPLPHILIYIPSPDTLSLTFT